MSIVGSLLKELKFCKLATFSIIGPEYMVKNYFSYFSSETYVVGTQKNRLNETVLLNTQNICLDLWVRK